MRPERADKDNEDDFFFIFRAVGFGNRLPRDEDATEGEGGEEGDDDDDDDGSSSCIIYGGDKDGAGVSRFNFSNISMCEVMSDADS